MRLGRLAWSAGAAAALAAPLPCAPSAAAIRVEPRVVEVGMLYRGSAVRVEGTAPPGLRLALVCVGEEGQVQLKRKGKIWNLLWMDVGKVTFDRVPSLYLVHVEPPEAGADGHAVQVEPWPGLGFEAIEARALPPEADPATRQLFRELVKLKQAERLYGVGPLQRHAVAEPARGTVLAGLGGPPEPARVLAELALPANVPPGEYQVRLVGQREGASEVLATGKLTVRRVGLASSVPSVARSHGLLYGVLSVAAALLVGLLSGVLFSGAKKGH